VNVGEIVTSVQRQFGDDSGAQITQTDIIRWINQAMVDIARKTDCVQDHKEASVTAGDNNYGLPDDFLNVRKVTYNDSPLQSTTMEIADIMWPERMLSASGGGNPQYYYIWAKVLYLYPTPATTGSGNLDIYYSRLPAAVTGTLDVPEIPVTYHEDIEKYCLSKAKELDDSMDESALLKKIYDDRIIESRYEENKSDSYPSVRLVPGDD
jgi:hypothetical protein